jgi:hypothetical protein
MSGGMTLFVSSLPWWIRAQIRVIEWLGWRPQFRYREWNAGADSFDYDTTDAASNRVAHVTWNEPTA